MNKESYKRNETEWEAMGKENGNRNRNEESYKIIEHPMVGPEKGSVFSVLRLTD